MPPVDVRKNRELTLTNMRLQREVERLKLQMSDGEALKKEARTAKCKLEEERKARLRIEAELDRHVQSGASDRSLGFEDEDLGSSPGWWAATVSNYCPSRPRVILIQTGHPIWRMVLQIIFWEVPLADWLIL